MTLQRDYFDRLAAAFVRGKLSADLPPEALRPLFDRPLDELHEEELHALIQLGEASGLRLHKFKRTMGLARVSKVLGILKGLQPQTLLDIGSGRGAFLWPLLEAFPMLPVTSVDILAHRVEDILAVKRGGIEQLEARQGDATKLPFPDAHFDVVTLLEVLEHIPDTKKALAEVCRVAQRAVVLSVPSKEDDNPEHIHLFDTDTLTTLLQQAGAARVNISHVLNHRIVVATLS